MIWLYVVALVSEVTGLVLAAHGFRRTWLEFRSPDDEFLAPIVKPLANKARIGYVHLRRWIGRPVPPSTVFLSSASVTVAAGSATLTIVQGPFPSVEDDPKAFMEAFERRFRTLSDRVDAAEEALRSNLDQADARHAEAIRAISELRDEARGQVRTITVGGLREQVAGWSLIVAGVLLAGVGDIINGA